MKELHNEILVTICQHTPFSYKEVSQVYERIKTIDGVLIILKRALQANRPLSELTEIYLALEKEINDRYNRTSAL